MHFYGSPEVGYLVRHDEWSEVMFSTSSLPPVPVVGIESDEEEEILARGDRLVSILPQPTNRLIISPLPHDQWQRETVPHPIEVIDVRLRRASTGEDMRDDDD